MKFLSASEAGKILSVAPNTITRWIEKGVFPNAFKIESTIRIPQSDLDALMQPHKEAI